TKASQEQLAVFSEVYYPEGWQAYIDDQPGELFRTDYILRGLSVPAGEHTITLVYNPRSAYQGALISQISSILLILALLGSIIGYIRKNRKCSSDQA
ncbi:MAG: YfhO family protein, partial [Odoribacter splanchnicus]